MNLVHEKHHMRVLDRSPSPVLPQLLLLAGVLIGVVTQLLLLVLR